MHRDASTGDEGAARSSSTCSRSQPPSPPPSPPSPPLLPGQRSVHTAEELRTALSDPSIGHIFLLPGSYLLGLQLDIIRSVKIEAVEPGSVVLDAQGNSRVMNISAAASDVIEISGVDITGGRASEEVEYNQDNYPADGISHLRGGGVLITSGQVTFTSTNIHGNEAGETGGGVCIVAKLDVTPDDLSAQAQIRLGPQATFVSSSIHGNKCTGHLSGKGGGGVSVDGGQAFFTSTSIHGNIATRDGGGVLINDAEATFTLSDVYDNKATVFGGGLQIRSSGGVVSGATFTSSQLYGNEAREGGFVYIGPEWGTAHDAYIHMTSVVLSANEAQKGSSIYFDSNILSTMINVTFVGHTSFPVVTRKSSSLRWICELGYYMPDTGDIGTDNATANFRGCRQNPCIAGYIGSTPNETKETCTEQCPPGQYCPTGSSRGSPCRPGTYWSYGRAEKETDCIECESGRFQPSEGEPDCNSCAAGTFSVARGSTACTECRAGGYCEDPGATSPSVFQQCAPGTWSDTIGLNTSAGCHQCGVGKYQSITGATSESACLLCPLGTASSSPGVPVCLYCEEGSYQGEPGKTACNACRAGGGYCPTGSSAPLSCPSGRFASEGGLRSVDQCQICPPGSFCSTGSVLPTECSPGTAAPDVGMGSCDKCAPGTYQAGYGATRCATCPLLGYCEEGAADPSSCPSSTYGATTGLRSAAECTACPIGGYCVSGEFFPCTGGLFNPSPNGSTASVCLSCDAHFLAAHLVTLAAGGSKADECICAAGYYDAAADSTQRDCVACDTTRMLCTRPGLTLATLPLREHHWRLSNRTSGIYACDIADNVSACLGGAEGYCADGHEGPLCRWCSNSSQYYDHEAASCEDCGDLAARFIRGVIILIAIAVALLLCRLALRMAPRLLGRCSSTIARLAAAADAVDLQAKFKMLLSFTQVWAVRTSVYGIEAPSEFSDWLGAFDFLGFDIGTLLFPAWSCAGGFRFRLAFNALWPLFLMAAVAAALVAHALLTRQLVRRALLRSLEVAVFISFCVLPSVTRSLFMAFECDSFRRDDLSDPPRTTSYLIASLDVECSSEEHRRIMALAAVFIAIWPIALPLLYAALLWRCRHDMRSHRPSALQRSIRFLWGDYENDYYWWELVVQNSEVYTRRIRIFAKGL